jgi:hypothetical protein
VTGATGWWVVTIIVLATAAAVLQQQLRAERQEMHREHERIVVLQSHASELRRPSSAIPAASADEPAPDAPAAEQSFRSGGPQADSRQERALAQRRVRRKMYAEPASRALLIADEKERQREAHGGLAEALDLSPDEEDRLLAVLAENDLRMMERAGGGDFTSHFESEQQKSDLELLAQLGQAKYAEFKRYQDSMAERQEVALFRRDLEEADDLTADAAERLIRALAEERARIGAQEREISGERRMSFGFGDGRSVSIGVEDEGHELEEAREQLEEQDQRRESIAAPLLTTAQRAAYAEFLRGRRSANLARIETSLRRRSR